MTVATLQIFFRAKTLNFSSGLSTPPPKKYHPYIHTYIVVRYVPQHYIVPIIIETFQTYSSHSNNQLKSLLECRKHFELPKSRQDLSHRAKCVD